MNDPRNVFTSEQDAEIVRQAGGKWQKNPMTGAYSDPKHYSGKR